jgi:hypothetical protein
LKRRWRSYAAAGWELGNAENLAVDRCSPIDIIAHPFMGEKPVCQIPVGLEIRSSG